MFPELTILSHLFQILHTRWQVLRADPEAGYSTETVVITALLVALREGLPGTSVRTATQRGVPR